MHQMHSCVSVVVVFMISIQLCHGAFSNNSEIENKMETEIIFAEPRSFAHKTKEYMVTRQDYAEKFKQYTKEGKLVSQRWLSKNEMWGHMAYNYRYETRQQYTACDMEPDSFSTFFDWACLVPCMYGNPHKVPTTIYVNTFIMPHFVESTLKTIDPSARFVLITAGDDLTIPRSIDLRYPVLRGFSRTDDGGKYYHQLLSDPRIIHWFIENHDMVHPKISTIPTGLTNDIHDLAVKHIPTSTHYFANRTLQILVSDRAREGTGQWATRAKVIKMCDLMPKYCLRPPQMTELGITHDKYVTLLQSVPFVACAHGGGIDPSPKAWEAIMAGTIPIIQHSPLDDAYEQLPVAFVNSWEELLQPESEEKLASVLTRWITELQPYYEVGSALRTETLEKLKAKYWAKQVQNKYDDYFKKLNGGTVSDVTSPVASFWNTTKVEDRGSDGNSDNSGSNSSSGSISSSNGDSSEGKSSSVRTIPGMTYSSRYNNVNTVPRTSTTEILHKPVRSHPS